MKIEKNHHENFPSPDLDQNLGQEKIHQEIHHGQIIERGVRRANIGISEIARNLNISRRTLYNWFETKTISLDIIIKVGHVIGHDFSSELPEEFSNENLNGTNHHFTPSIEKSVDKKEAVYYWMERYIKLLEDVNHNLTNKNTLKNDSVN